ncbi:four helix bundle protein [Pedobacter aquae]|uniref:Four helix bundle protein n=1 Tax=Pedobacter aquae TaxID=2605747 RepID=A0A5C0VNU7_9SPHI|nr:four helix bundle protein [Pedobacter aquae]QEK52674.1 four helix bundle protein [Pedobacter aquae]
MSKPYDIKERTFQFSKDLIFFIKETNTDRTYNSIIDQVLRSGTSVGANVEEGKSGSSKNDFKKFYIIALKSANETKYWLRLLKETNIIETESIKRVDILINEINEISKIIATIVINMGK